MNPGDTDNAARSLLRFLDKVDTSSRAAGLHRGDHHPLTRLPTRRRCLSRVENKRGNVVFEDDAPQPPGQTNWPRDA